ncbi:MAG: outer membrane lipoprotein-sorting protein [Epsilonproteobacteria bacterium]|nr:outer membrane lipoprotein-sorting protein [Campylobacterota bacterium]
MKKSIISLIVAVNLFAVTNLEVAQKSDDASSGFESSTSKMTMTLINKTGQKSVRELAGKTLELDGGDKGLMEFLSPSDVKGTKLLTYEHIQRDDDQWLYMPALKRVKRISSRNKTGSFMGSEFSYEDISAQDIDKYSYSGDAQEVEINGIAAYQGERVPKDKNSGYTKQVTWVDKTRFVVLRVDYYDRKKELLKTANFSGYKKIEGVWRVGQIHMKNMQTGKETILAWSQDKIKQGLNAGDFNKRVLK